MITEDLVIKTLGILMGIVFLIGSLFYRKNDHQKARANKSLGNYSDSFNASVMGGMIGTILQLAPWWLPKILFFLIGVSFLYAAIFLV